MTSPGETLIESVPNIEIAAQESQVGGFLRTVQLLGRTATRLALSVSLAATGGALAGITAEMVESNPAVAYALDTAGYPDSSKPCVAGDPKDPKSSYGKTQGTGYWCSGYQWGDSPRAQNSSRGYGYRNCTDFVAWVVESNTDLDIGGMSHATLWDNNAASKGLTVRPAGEAPQVGDIAHWEGNDTDPSKNYGHVGIVISADPLKIAEYNGGRDGNYRIRPNNSGIDHYIAVPGLSDEEADTAPPPASPEITTTLSASSSGPISSILEPSGRRSIFSGSATGNLYWSHWTPNENGWTTGQIASPGSAIKGIASVRWDDGRLSVYYGTAGGGVYESWYQPGGGWNTNLIANTASSVNGIAAQAIDTPTEDQVNVFYGSSDGTIRESWWKTGLPWTTGIIDTVNSPVNAVTLLRPTNGPDTVVFSGTSSGELHEDYWRGPGYSWTGTQAVNFGAPISSLTAMMYGNTETVYAGTGAGNVAEAWFTPGDSSWSTGTVGTYNGPVTALTGMTYSSGHVGIVAASSGNLGERFWSPNNSWAGGQIAALGNTVLGAAIMQTPAGAKIVYTVSGNGQIRESWWADGQSAWTTGQIGTAS